MLRAGMQAGARASAVDEALRRMWCNATRSEGTFVYLGADVDVEMLRTLQPPESSILFMDSLDHHFDEFEDWEFHHSTDMRPSYRVTTKRIRAMSNATSKLLALRSLLGHRLIDVFGGPVEVTPPRGTSLQATFVYQGRKRHLLYAMNLFADFGKFGARPQAPISTFTHVGVDFGGTRRASSILGAVPWKRSFRYITSQKVGLEDLPWPSSRFSVLSEIYARKPHVPHRLAGTQQLLCTCLRWEGAQQVPRPQAALTANGTRKSERPTSI